METSRTEHEEITQDDVVDRNSLGMYLSKSLIGDYIEVVGDGEYSQRAPFIKTYMIESHLGSGRNLVSNLSKHFLEVQRLEDESLYRLLDAKQTYYFVDAMNPRFLAIHTTGKVGIADQRISRLARSAGEGFDRAWLPTEFLEAGKRGRMTGFKFGFQEGILGLEPPAESIRGVPSEMLNRKSRFGMAVSEPLRAEAWYRTFQQSDIASGKKALDHISFVDVIDDGEFINSTVYAHGKIVGSGTAYGGHIQTVERAISAYENVIRKIEAHRVGWVAEDGVHVFRGDPFILTFPPTLVIADLTAFAESIFRPSLPFQLLGILHHATSRRIDIEAVDMHTDDPFSVELTHQWMRIFLPQESCGNVIARLYSNLQRSVSSDVELFAGTGERLFEKGLQA